MSPISSVINQTQTTIDNRSKNILKPQLTIVDTKKVDHMLEESRDLIKPQFKGWFAKRFYQISPSRLQELCGMARSGRQPVNLFCWLVRREVGY